MAMTKEERAAYNKEYRKANIEKINAQKKEYYKANKEKIKDYLKANKEKIKDYYKANKEKIKDYYKDYYKANKDKCKEYDKEYRNANKEKRKAQRKKYNKANLDKRNVNSSKRRALRQAALHPHRSDILIAQLYSLSTRLTKCTGIIHNVDHIIPLACGGYHHEDNLQVIPAILNYQKKDNVFLEHPTLKTYRDVPISLWSPDFKTMMSKRYRSLLIKYCNDTVRCRD